MKYHRQSSAINLIDFADRHGTVEISSGAGTTGQRVNHRPRHRSISVANRRRTARR